MCGGKCEYVAKKDEPENWYGEEPSEWFLDGNAEGGGLDIEKWRCPHPKLGETEYCVFHTDPEELPENVDEGEEILKALDEAGESPFEDGPEHRGQFVGATFGAVDLSGERIAANKDDVRFDHTKFYGNGEDLDFEGTKFVTEGEKSVSFLHSEFIGKKDGDVNFREARFETDEGDGDVNFREARFETDEGDGDVNFREARFETGAGDGGVDFGNVRFRTCSEDGDVNFRGARFETGEGDGDVAFWDVTFETGKGEGDVAFGGSTFKTGEGDGDVAFGSARFKTGEGDGNVNFYDATFETGKGDGNVYFGGSTFETGKGDGNVYFGGSTFETGKGDGNVYFWGATFETGEGDGNVYFWGATFETGEGDGDVSFGDVTFATGEGDGDLDFRESTFETGEGDGDVDFWGATFEAAKGNGDVNFEVATFETGGGKGEVNFGVATFETGEGDGDVNFRGARFETGEGDGDVNFQGATFEAAKGNGDVHFGRIKLGSAGDDQTGDQTKICEKLTERKDQIITFEDTVFVGVVRFENAGVDASETLTFSGAKFEEEFVYGPDTGIPYITGYLDFSDVIFEEQPNFFGGRQSIDHGSTESMTGELFDAVFVDSVDFSDAQFPEGVDFSDFKFSADTTFDGAELSGANFSRADLTGVSFERATLNRTEFLGANLQGAHLYGALLGDARVNRNTKFWPEIPDMRYRDVICLSDNPLGGGFYRRFKTKLRRGRIPYCAEDPRYAELDIESLPQSREPNLEKAAEVYATIEQVARDNSLPGLASEAFLGRKDVQHREYRKEGRLSMRLRSFVPNLVARYGESPWRVLGTGAIIVLVWGVAYQAFDLIERQSGGADPTLIETIYFSSLTFTTLGYGDFRPRNTLGQVLAVSETAFGVILLAILVFVFGRRATR